ncbi:lipid A export permease/ATP-binding protein MsbA [Guyparkeria hydrothermalis]|uniref:lipid A export permease/ATP-binding protein MsbA n=1 Tax=Guyparkeria hydrothermalis TaxID=923 RepID=UPI0020210317|nr:lipid A export permease/ATP-binding protein MsbA [Guyparkeria hydrothermalis]MCL7744227.1 lipid A export permease/ATP-binding protein MsbA [Guyparkeria hydrothermalis]
MNPESLTQRAHDVAGTETYRRLLGYTWRYLRVLVIAIVGMVVAGLSEVGFAALMKPLLDGSFVERDPTLITWMPVALLGVFVFRVIGEFASNYGMAWVGRSVIRDLRSDTFDQVLHLPPRYFDRVPSTEVLTRLNYQSEQVSEAASKALTILIRDSVTVIGLLVWMLYLSWQLTLFILVLLPLLVGMVAGISRAFRRYARRIQESMGQVSHVAEETITGHRVVKLYGGEDYESARFDRQNQSNFRAFMKMQAVQAASSPLTQFVLAIGVAGVVWFATSGERMEQISVGTFVSFITALAMTLAPAKRLINLNAIIQKGIAAGESLFALLDEPRENERGATPVDRVSGRIRFDDVWLSYRDPAPESREDGDWVLRGVTLDIPAGETVAFVGQSGAGKSSLMGVLPRFVEIQAGRVLLDDTAHDDLPLTDLRRQFAYVSQETVLFNASIAANIGYADGADYDLERVREAARAAFADEFIEQMPEGFETSVGENGVLLSGGQRQRIAIARALYRDAPILLLDEATSALDTRSEGYIQRALANLTRGRTTLVIAHRLSTIEHADRIVVMEGGRIVEQGRHDELLAADGAYAGLYRLQFAEQAED